MVKVGFICEGGVEKLLVDSKLFQALLLKLNLYFVQSINAEGKDNLLPHRIVEHRQTLKEKGADKIIILTDLDENACFTRTKERILKTQGMVVPQENEFIVISVKQIEAWFLADSEAMSHICKQKFQCTFPEQETIAYNTIRSEFLRLTGRGYGKNAKVKFANDILRNGFSIENAAKHPNCPSVAYFLNTLIQIEKNV